MPQAPERNHTSREVAEARYIQHNPEPKRYEGRMWWARALEIAPGCIGHAELTNYNAEDGPNPDSVMAYTLHDLHASHAMQDYIRDHCDETSPQYKLLRDQKVREYFDTVVKHQIRGVWSELGIRKKFGQNARRLLAYVNWMDANEVRETHESWCARWTHWHSVKEQRMSFMEENGLIR